VDTCVAGAKTGHVYLHVPVLYTNVKKKSLLHTMKASFILHKYPRSVFVPATQVYTTSLCPCYTSIHDQSLSDRSSKFYWLWLVLVWYNPPFSFAFNLRQNKNTFQCFLHTIIYMYMFACNYQTLNTFRKNRLNY
jgi:hypothetical protein